jgi:hypothetical protein
VKKNPRLQLEPYAYRWLMSEGNGS